MTGPDVLAIGQVLRGVRFPAHRWQLIAQADLYGADGVTRERLYELPERRYPDWTAVVSELATTRPGRPPAHAPRRDLARTRPARRDSVLARSLSTVHRLVGPTAR